MTTRPITLCIVNYEGERYLRGALQAAMPHSQFAEILVVDNASRDGSIVLLQTDYPHVRTVQLATNTGPAGARNAGARAAQTDLILFQDNDVRLTSDCTDYLYVALNAFPNALLAAPRVLYAHNPTQVQYDSANCHVLGLMAPRNADRRVADLDNKIARTTSLVTACFLIDRARWSSGPLFDEHFGFNYEDHDFGVRARLIGHELLIEPRAQVLHGDGTRGLSYRSGGLVPAQRVLYLIRNRWFIVARVFSWRTLLLLSPVLVLYEVNQFAGALYKGWLPQWWQALQEFFAALPRLRCERRALQATRRTPDRDILHAGPLPFTVAVKASFMERLAAGLLQAVINGWWRIVRPLL